MTKSEEKIADPSSSGNAGWLGLEARENLLDSNKVFAELNVVNFYITNLAQAIVAHMLRCMCVLLIILCDIFASYFLISHRRYRLSRACMLTTTNSINYGTRDAGTV